MSIRTARARAFQFQNGRCFYCGKPMCASSEALASFSRCNGLTEKIATQLIATAEHLQARCDGGNHALNNIVAAHAICNRRRHQSKKPKDPVRYREYVLNRCGRGRWHDPRVLRL